MTSAVQAPSAFNTVCVELTKRCHLSCSHCWAMLPDPPRADLDLEELRGFIADLQGEGLRHVSISGGEPALVRGLTVFLQWIVDRGLYFTLTTSGTAWGHINAEPTEWDESITSKGRIRVSLDGYEQANDAVRGVGVFAAAIEFTRRVKNEVGWVGINTVSLPASGDNLELFAETLERIGVDEWMWMTPVPMDTALSEREQREILDTIDRRLAIARRFFHGRLHCADYYGRPHGSFVLRADGTLILSNSVVTTAPVVGHYAKVDARRVSAVARAEVAERGPAFFHMPTWWIRDRPTEDG